MIDTKFEAPGTFNSQNPQIRILRGHSIVFVGANGSGKTRLAVFIEKHFGELAHRISAHRALLLNPSVAKTSESLAMKGLLYGYADKGATVGHRLGHRWANDKPETTLLNDFDYLLQALFGEQSRTALDTHNKHHAGTLAGKTLTKFQKLKAIWDELLPHRSLVIEGDDIKVKATQMSSPLTGTEPIVADLAPTDQVASAGAQSSSNWEPYSAAEMSDGERAMFYLIGQAMVAPKDSILIVDEPELHLHRAVLGKLWDLLEGSREDCCFIFITHDLEFAAGRKAAKYVIRSYHPHGPTWELAQVSEAEGFSEELTTLLLGSRRPVLFVEGTAETLDIATYRSIYPEWTVVARGPCDAVIHSVATFRDSPQFTRIQCKGLVDADGHDQASIEHLAAKGVHVLPVSEIENLFLLPTVLTQIAALEKFNEEDATAKVNAIHDEMFAMFGTAAHIEKAAVRFGIRKLDQILKRISLDKPKQITDLGAQFAQKVQAVDIAALAEERRAAIQAAVDDREVAEFLKLMDNKGMLSLVAAQIKQSKANYFEEWLIRSMHHEDGAALVAALRSVLPTMQS